MKIIRTRPEALLAPVLLAGGLLLGAPAPSNADAMTGNLWNQIHPTTGSTFTTDGGITHQVWQRHGIVTDDTRKFVAFYTDVINYRLEGGIVQYETNGKWVFPDDNPQDDVTHQVFLHTRGQVNLRNGEWIWELSEVTGGTGRFANVTAQRRENYENQYGGANGGCLNPPGDPPGFPNIVLCQYVADWSY